MTDHLVIDAQWPDAAVLTRAASVLESGRLVVFPTDTLYGLAADPRQPAAVASLVEAKGREAAQAVPLIAADLAQVEATMGPLGPAARRVAARLWPGPLSLVLDAPAPLVRAGVTVAGTVAVRVPAHAVARELARAFGYPVTATSANRSGHPAHADARSAVDDLGAAVALVLDAGPVPGGLPSTIVRIAGDEATLVRADAVSFERVLELLR